MARAKAPRKKHVPLRTCIACRQTRSKRELVRVVRTPGGDVKVDLTGKLSGRGAYLCRAQDCWEQALNSQRLNSALKTTLTAAEVATLRSFAATLPKTRSFQSGQKDELLRQDTER